MNAYDLRFIWDSLTIRGFELALPGSYVVRVFCGSGYPSYSIHNVCCLPYVSEQRTRCPKCQQALEADRFDARFSHGEEEWFAARVAGASDPLRLVLLVPLWLMAIHRLIEFLEGMYERDHLSLSEEWPAKLGKRLEQLSAEI